MSNFINTTIKVHTTLIAPILGMEPGNKDIYSKYIASKAPDSASIEEEIATRGETDVMKEHITVFPRDEQGQPFLWDYQLKGFFKDSCGLLRNVPGTECSKIKAYKKKIDGNIFIGDRQNPIITEEPITVCERRLRASTPQGERIGLAASEEIAEGAKIDFDVWVMIEDDIDVVLEMLNYGRLHGFGQWRNSGKGRFQYHYEIEQDGVITDKGGNDGFYD